MPVVETLGRHRFELDYLGLPAGGFGLAATSLPSVSSASSQSRFPSSLPSG